MTLNTLRAHYRFIRTQPGFFWSLVWGILFCAIGLPAPLFMKPHLQVVTNGLMQCPDLLLDILPSVTTFGIAVWGPVLVALLCITAFLLHPWYAPITLKATGILFLVRAFAIILTPLGLRGDQYITQADTFLHSISYVGNDYIFSGHVAFPFLLSLIFMRNRNWQNLFLLCTFVMAVAVLLEHIHYTIDVFVAPFITYGIWKLCERYLTKDMGYIREAHVEFHAY